MKTLLALSLLFTASAAQAGLIKGDFLAQGNGMLITDTATHFEWLSPVYTRSLAYNSGPIQSLETTYGFRYATYAEAYSMITSNFGFVTTVAVGDAAGFNAAQNFMNIFGTAEFVSCGSPCPRTQGLTADQGAFPNTHYGIGMITFGTTGWMIDHNSWSDNSADQQMGSWLVRGGSSAPATPEPASVGLALAGLGAVLLFRRR